MHSIAQKHYQNRYRLEAEHRRTTDPQSEFYDFCVKAYDDEQKEKCLVGMVMAWSAITLESLVNHAIAEVIDDTARATLAIEYPRKITQTFTSGKSVKSDLAAKIYIINGRADNNVEHILEKAEIISKIRNIIIHDKPYEHWENQGEYDSYYYSTREFPHPNFRYEDLHEFYQVT